MTDPPRPDSSEETRDDTDLEPERGTTTGTSRWQKVVGIIGLLVVLWVGNQMVGQLTGRGLGPGGFDHAPGQDAPPADIPEQETDAEDGGHTPPAGGRDH